jgi:hypothetical protein
MTSATHKSTPSCLPPQLQQLAAIHGARKTTILFHFKYEVTKYDKLTVTKQNKLTNMKATESDCKLNQTAMLNLASIMLPEILYNY